MLIGRWHRADSYPLPTLKRVPLDEVHKHLPADTPRFSPAERDKQIRARNLGLQLRRRW